MADIIKPDALKKRIEDGSIAGQKAWKFIKELNSEEERLDATAIISGDRKYSYRQMFSIWTKYAGVFSALNITSENASRVGFACTSSAEAIMAMYGLNMTGAVLYALEITSTFNINSLAYYISKNGITDLVVSDVLLFPANLRKLMSSKDELGLRNIILLHTDAAGPVNNALTAFYCESNSFMLHKIDGVLFMDELLVQYEGFPVYCGSYRKTAPAIVLQTSGTTKGAHKPVPHSDYSFNSGAVPFLKNPELLPVRRHAIVLHSLPAFDASYGTEDMLHMPFALGMAVVVNYGLGLRPESLIKLISYYRVNFALVNTSIMDGLMMQPDSGCYKLDSLECVALGGSYLSEDKRKIYNRFLEEHGCRTKLINGYGMSEFCGACVFSPAEREDDTIGYPLPGIKIRVQDQNDGIFYSPEEGSRVGDLYIASPSLALEKLDGERWSERIEIDGDSYLRTNDMVAVKEDGCLSYAGRSNRYFVGNAGIRFDSGRVETAVSAREGIHDCAIIPRYSKPLHDTIPVLCVRTASQGPEGVAALNNAMRDVFIHNGLIKDSNLPTYCIITDNIPYNVNGKVDVYRMTRGELTGQTFIVKPVRAGGKLTDILLIPVPQMSEFDFISAPEEIEEDYVNEFFAMIDQYKPWLMWLKRMPRFTQEG